MRGKVALLGTLVIILALCGTVHADSVLLGSDYLTTLPDTYFNFGPGIGPVPLKGLPIGPGNTDTIVQRQANAILPVVGSSATIPIEMVALSLTSVAPVNISGSFFDIFINLTPGTHSIGQMTINHEFPDNHTSLPEGTFTSLFFDVFFDATFKPVGGGPGFQISDMLSLVTDPPGLWSHESPPGVILVPGLPGDQNANLHSPLPPSSVIFLLLIALARLARLWKTTQAWGCIKHNPPLRSPAPSGCWAPGCWVWGAGGGSGRVNQAFILAINPGRVTHGPAFFISSL